MPYSKLLIGSGQLGYNFRKCLSFACIQSSILFSHLGLITLFLKSMQCFLTTWVMTLVHPLHLLQCWLKKQKDTLAPERQDMGQKVIWTSGLIFGKGEVYNLNIFGWCELFFYFEIRSFLSFSVLYIFAIDDIFCCISFFFCSILVGHCWFGNGIWHSSYKSKWSFDAEAIRCCSD